MVSAPAQSRPSQNRFAVLRFYLELKNTSKKQNISSTHKKIIITTNRGTRKPFSLANQFLKKTPSLYSSCNPRFVKIIKVRMLSPRRTTNKLTRKLIMYVPTMKDNTVALAMKLKMKISPGKTRPRSSANNTWDRTDIWLT